MAMWSCQEFARSWIDALDATRWQLLESYFKKFDPGMFLLGTVCEVCEKFFPAPSETNDITVLQGSVRESAIDFAIGGVERYKKRSM